MYSDEELKTIRAIITGDATPENSSNYTSIDDKLNKDENFKKLGRYAFFPESYDMIYNNDGTLEVRKCGETRGTGIILRNSSKTIVIKPVQKSLVGTKPEDADEIEIARFAGLIGFGPKQYATLKGYITEEYLDGELFTRIHPQELSPENMFSYGKQLGAGLKKMHESGFYYNDTIVADDMGKSHLIITDKGLKLFDFGAAINLRNHPNYSDEQAFNFGRTKIGAEFFTHSKYSQEQLNRFIDDHKKELQSKSKEQIMIEDEYFVMIGISYASMRFRKNLNEFAEGFIQEYRK